MSLRLDHLAVAASSLREGTEYVRDCLGIDMPFGGEHTHMGTHNCLVKLGSDEFLEVIAINPDAPNPPRPRWFNLDHHGNRSPYLAHWIARTDDMSSTLPNITAPVGEPILSKRGNLSWHLTIPSDGSLAFDGAFPSIIEWPMRPFPGASMHDVGCRVLSLELGHPEAVQLENALQPHLSDERIQITQADTLTIKASISTPTGVRYLE